MKVRIGDIVEIVTFKQINYDTYTTFPALVTQVVSADGSIVDLAIFTSDGVRFQKGATYSKLPALGKWTQRLNIDRPKTVVVSPLEDKK